MQLIDFLASHALAFVLCVLLLGLLGLAQATLSARWDRAFALGLWRLGNPPTRLSDYLSKNMRARTAEMRAEVDKLTESNKLRKQLIGQLKEFSALLQKSSHEFQKHSPNVVTNRKLYEVSVQMLATEERLRALNPHQPRPEHDARMLEMAFDIVERYTNHPERMVPPQNKRPQ